MLALCLYGKFINKYIDNNRIFCFVDQRSVILTQSSYSIVTKKKSSYSIMIIGIYSPLFYDSTLSSTKKS